MNLQDFEWIARLLKQRSGLVLSQDKAYLIESRLNPVARKHDLKSCEELISKLRMNGDESVLREVVEAMTTNESFFFRDQKPFDQFRDLVLPELMRNRANQKRLRIWSAAASSGQEAYSLAIILKEQANRLRGWNTSILGTDISTDILKRAKEGIYTQFEVQRGLPINHLVRYFKKIGERWQINDDLRDMVEFKHLNLLDTFSGLGKFDVIFCRNVLIYFDRETKTKVLDSIANHLEPDGYLYLGGAETILGISDRFELVPGCRGLFGLVGEGSDARLSL